jgi:K+-transporting ATPase KdpF subunit
MHYSERGLLSCGHRLHHRLRTVGHEGEQMMLEIVLLGLVTVALLVYLVYALLRPEQF